MADNVKISELSVATTSAAADSIPIVQDGVTKRIHPGPAGGLDAGTVSGAGIGAPSVTITTFAQAFAGGMKLRGANIAGGPTTGELAIDVTASTGYDAFYAVDMATGYSWFGYRAHGAGVVTWKRLWGSDDTSGQPPASKSNRISNTTVGWIDAVDCASGGTVTLPTGGTFETKVMTYGATYNGVKCAIVAGGAMSGTASANLVMSYKRLS